MNKSIIVYHGIDLDEVICFGFSNQCWMKEQGYICGGDISLETQSC